MITLTRITEPARLEEYHRFRYRIYNESRQQVFVASSTGIDHDAYDERAHHFGWYVGEELAGCIRFVEPDGSISPLPMFSLLTEPAAHAAVRAYIAARAAKGDRMVEASRFCLAPEHRGLRTAKEFVFAMLKAMYPLGVLHGLFDCDVRHGRFYAALGFGAVEHCKSWQVPFLPYPSCVKQYDLERMLRVNAELRESMGFDKEVEKMAA